MSFALKCLQRSQGDFSSGATATTATTATGRRADRESVATVATVAVAAVEKSKINGTVTAPEPGACVTCAHFRPKPGQTPDGQCAKHHSETWAQYAGGCADDWTPADPAARELERRRARVVARLKADSTLRYSFDVQGASLTAPASGPVSVMLGLRTAIGGIVTGELIVPADRWPGVALFNERLRQSAEGLPS